MDLGLKDKVALITGGDSGVGFAAAELLVQEGARILITDKEGPALKEALRRLAPLGEVLAIPADLTSKTEVERLAVWAEHQFGGLHIVVHAADPSREMGDLLSVTDEQWKAYLDTDLMGVVRVCQAAIPRMQEAEWGRVLLLPSEDAIARYPDELPYRAAKAAVINLFNGLSRTYAQDGILINTILPAFATAPMTQDNARQDGEARPGTQSPDSGLRDRERIEAVTAAIAWLRAEPAEEES